MVSREGVRHVHTRWVSRPVQCLFTCPLKSLMDSSYIPKSKIADPQNLNLWLKVRHAAFVRETKQRSHFGLKQINDQIKQNGNTSDMIFRIPRLIQHISSIMTLEEGDLVLTGTPAGVGPVSVGDKIECALVDAASNDELERITFGVAERTTGYLYRPSY
jgi:acylpyruvate hydrolase